jgi:signal transduction histidine kinase
MRDVVQGEVALIQRMDAVPTILETVAAVTGLGFVCIAHVTADSWTCCAVLDRLGFGLQAGDGLDVTTTLCEEVRDTGKAVIIDRVSLDPVYHAHHTPRIYGFESYISIPVYRRDGSYFGTLCGLDPKPAVLNTPAIVSSLTLFAQLLSLQMESDQQLTDTRHLLADERETAELREQFIAVLGHDVRTPLSSILTAVDLARRRPGTMTQDLFAHIGRSARRISGLVDDVVDFTRGRMGGGIALDLRREDRLHAVFDQVLAELRDIHPERSIRVQMQPIGSLQCDPGRMGQLLSNLVKNALVHGDAAHPVDVVITHTNDVLQITVSNAGPRIPDEVKRQLFKPFWRDAASPTPAAREQRGLGLGLFIVSEIARSHGGQIHVHTSDEATTFQYQAFGPHFVERRGTPRVTVSG